MVDPHTAAAGTGTLMTVVVFIGSQLSPSIMIRRAVKKELKAAALLEKNGSYIGSDGWDKLTRLEQDVRRSKLSLEDTTWGELFKQPVKLLLRAHRYHDASDAYLYYSRSVSAEAITDAARSSAGRSSTPSPAADHSEANTSSSIAQRHGELDDAAGFYISYESIVGVENSYETYFNNVEIIAGAKARIILHFGVGDVSVIFNPCTQLPGVPAWYSGPLILSGIAKLIPNTLETNRVHAPDVCFGRREYDLEFGDLHCTVPPDHQVSVRRFEDDGASIASFEATYGGNRTTMMMLDDEIDLLTPYYRPIARR